MRVSRVSFYQISFILLVIWCYDIREKHRDWQLSIAYDWIKWVYWQKLDTVAPSWLHHWINTAQTPACTEDMFAFIFRVAQRHKAVETYASLLHQTKQPQKLCEYCASWLQFCGSIIVPIARMDATTHLIYDLWLITSCKNRVDASLCTLLAYIRLHFEQRKQQIPSARICHKQNRSCVSHLTSTIIPLSSQARLHNFGAASLS